MLTKREREIVIILAAEGLRNKQIARRLNLREGTVKMHLHSIYLKLNISTRTELVLWNVRNQDQSVAWENQERSCR